MTSYNVHAGHCPQGQGASGAVGILKESVEDRLVKNEVIRLLRKEGHTVYDCTVDYNTTQNGCLSGIVSKCNQHSVSLDISIHLNSGRNDYSGDGSTGGTEVFNYDTRTKSISDRICNNISSVLNIRNRGTKYNKNLYVLSNTKSLAILVECCFVDDKDDANRWDYRKCAKAIVDGILGYSVSNSGTNAPSDDSGSSSENIQTNLKIPVKYQAYSIGKWWGNVTDYNTSNSNGYAGVIGYPVMAIRANTVGSSNQAGCLEYRAHGLNGRWYNWQRDRIKDSNGENYAGDCKNKIDGFQMRIVGISEKHVKYRVHCIGKGWLGWVTDYGNGDDGYAGWYGYTVDAVQIEII